MAFEEYVANGKYVGDFKFDFLIADEVAKGWYDSFDNQFFPERGWCLDHLAAGDVVVDAGAHHGLMSVLFANQVGPTGKVIAYEVLPRNAKIAARNVQLNGLSNVDVRHRGLGERRSRNRYTDYGGNVVVAEAAGAAADVLEIVSLDDDLAGQHIDFIKIDVEGSDLEAVRGSRKTISQAPVLDLELHNFLFKDRSASIAGIFDVLRVAKYRYSVLPTIDGSILDVGLTVDLAWLATFENPHVFALPA